MGSRRDNKIASLYITLAAEFLEKEFDGQELLTVTNIEISKDRKLVTILFTIFPDDKQERALRLLKRARSDFREYVKTKTRFMAICPTFDFAVDLGEKNRQKIDKLLY